MPKLKTNKTISKRIKVTKSKKLLAHQAGQSHFRSRKTGSKKMGIRKFQSIAKVDVRNIRRTLPYY